MTNGFSASRTILIWISLWDRWICVFKFHILMLQLKMAILFFTDHADKLFQR